MTLKAASTSDSTNKTVSVTDANGTKVLTLVVSKTGATLSAPGETDISMTFYSALEEIPTDYTASRMAVYVAGIRALNSSTTAMPDSPGCDWFPDTQCTLDCCAQHDQCYRENNCGASSWIWGFGSSACNHCNTIAYDCIAAACAGVTESFLPNNCFDAKCNMFYDCPPDYNSCTCRDICADSGLTIPATCGDGRCAVEESATTCWNDCSFGVPATAPENPGVFPCPSEFVSAEAGTWPLSEQWGYEPDCCPLVPVYDYHCRYGPKPASASIGGYSDYVGFALYWATEPRDTLGCGNPPTNPGEDIVSATHSAEVSHGSTSNPTFGDEQKAFATNLLRVLEQGIDGSGNKVLPAGAAPCE